MITVNLNYFSFCLSVVFPLFSLPGSSHFSLQSQWQVSDTFPLLLFVQRAQARMPLLDLRGDSSACAASGLTKRWKANQGGQEELHSRRQPGAALPCRSLCGEVSALCVFGGAAKLPRKRWWDGSRRKESLK